MSEGGDPDDTTVVQEAASAAENVIFSRIDRSEIRDFDVSVSFEDAQLEVDIYIDAPDKKGAEQVAEDAALAARSATDDLLA